MRVPLQMFRLSGCAFVVQSNAHKRACALLEKRGWDVCWFCGVGTNGKGIMDSHVAGSKHRQRMDLTYCSTCDTRATSHHDMIQHLRSMRHRVILCSSCLAFSACT